MNTRDSIWPSDDEIRMLRKTFAQVIPPSEALCDRFYTNLFAAAPAVKPLFPTDMQEQRDKLIMMLASAIDLLDDPKEFRLACRACGFRHQKYGAEESQFGLVTKLLLTELDETLQPKMSEEQMVAWKKLLDAISAEMLIGFCQTEPSPTQ